MLAAVVADRATAHTHDLAPTRPKGVRSRARTWISLDAKGLWEAWLGEIAR